MNLTTLRDMLRGRVHDKIDLTDSGGSTMAWRDGYLLAYINAAYQEIQKKYVKVLPEGLLKTQQVSLIAGQALYQKPNGLRYEIELGYKDSSYALGYRPMDLVTYNSIARIDSVYAEAPVYSHEGNYYRISPVPSAAVTAGLQVKFSPILSVQDGSDVFAVPEDLHYAILLQAEIMVKGETEENLTALYSALDKALEDIGGYSSAHAQRPDTLIPDIDNGTGSRYTGGYSNNPARHYRSR